MTDGIDVQLDLTGGYYDAGDYLKFTFPLSYSVFMLSWGGNRLDDKSTSTSLYALCSGPDSGIPLPRPSYQINETHFGTDVASMTAAAFATASSFFRLLGSVTGNQDDKSYADILLSHSTQLYNCSKSIVPIRYHFSVPTLLGFYGSTDYLDDLILSSIAFSSSV
ncbi:hypothetical protein RO3G_08013 [Rhizopus delemar RA 99-880]|uniref:cellulase n=1 Tax=Rhizopus delemar (strain RA 99-880 / ATCC MYA-4621 / FGSC 9543 / NRRL 43880) TaxID=246409 RepID=I1C4C8_RHIO9|nr:hypothetical protein RO3G_08013 [Rhizopus delemar RA 99-880]|eukprot:EIE83308.1 hypothetical protein RO3G_08013 [Rhizopus delemar RA 99-880]